MTPLLAIEPTITSFQELHKRLGLHRANELTVDNLQQTSIHRVARTTVADPSLRCNLKGTYSPSDFCLTQRFKT